MHASDSVAADMYSYNTEPCLWVCGDAQLCAPALCRLLSSTCLQVLLSRLPGGALEGTQARMQGGSSTAAALAQMQQQQQQPFKDLQGTHLP
jgi:hypothetical protein